MAGAEVPSPFDRRAPKQAAAPREIDIVVFDRQYSPLLFEFEGATVVPVEAVYAVFEAKQEFIGKNVTYAPTSPTPPPASYSSS